VTSGIPRPRSGTDPFWYNGVVKCSLKPPPVPEVISFQTCSGGRSLSLTNPYAACGTVTVPSEPTAFFWCVTHNLPTAIDPNHMLNPKAIQVSIAMVFENATWGCDRGRRRP
jgi:hypothetical protein